MVRDLGAEAVEVGLAVAGGGVKLVLEGGLSGSDEGGVGLLSLAARLLQAGQALAHAGQAGGLHRLRGGTELRIGEKEITMKITIRETEGEGGRKGEMGG